MNYPEKIREKIYLARLNSLDTDVFIEIYHFYVDKIYRYLYLRTRSKEDAEDLAADVFMRTWEYVYKKQNTIKYLNAFLFQMAKNLISDYYRNSKDETIMENNAVSWLMDEKQQNLGLKFDQDVKFSEIEKALDGLKDEYKDAIILHYIEGFSSSEISKIMNRSKGAIRILIHRALKDLRENLTHQNM